METAQNFPWSGRTALNLQSELTDSITAPRGDDLYALQTERNHITAIRADSVLWQSPDSSTARQGMFCTLYRQGTTL